MKIKVDTDNFSVKKFEKIINKYKKKIRPSKTVTISLGENGQFKCLHLGVRFIEEYNRSVDLPTHEKLMNQIQDDMEKAFGWETADYDSDCIMFY